MTDPLTVTEDELYALIGRQAVEIRLLRTLLARAAAAQAAPQRPNGAAVSHAAPAVVAWPPADESEPS